MDPHIITQVLAKRIDGVVCLNQGIQGIDPFFRCCCRVGRFPPELDIDRHAAECLLCQMMTDARMCGKSRVNVLKISLTDEASLRASVLSAFLTRCSVETDLTADLIDHAF